MGQFGFDFGAKAPRGHIAIGFQLISVHANDPG